jgi:hypothetical protein
MADEQAMEAGNFCGSLRNRIERGHLLWRGKPRQSKGDEDLPHLLLFADVLLNFVRPDLGTVDVPFRIDRHAFGGERAAGCRAAVCLLQ